MAETAPQINVLLPHPINFYPEYTDVMLRPKPGIVVPWAETTHTPKGVITQDGFELPFFQLTLGEPLDLPDYKPGIFNVVSALTIQAVYRHNETLTPGQRRPTDDLLFPVDVQRDEFDNILGARGLGMPIKAKHAVRPYVIPEGQIGKTVHNACFYSVDIYAPDAPEDVGLEDEPIIPMPGAADYLKIKHHLEPNPLTDVLGVPVYNSLPVRLEDFDQSKFDPEGLYVTNLNVSSGIGSLALENGAGLIVPAKSVRSTLPGNKGQLVGGRAYGMVDQSVLYSFKV